jgi:3-dehydroquinate dehydratase type I
MLCVTGNESSIDELDRRLVDVAGRHPNALQEVRLDALEQPAAALPVLRRHADRLVVCCRPVRQGGAFSGAEADRLALLAQVAGLGVAHLDVEADVADASLQAMRKAGARSLLLSWHWFEGFSPGSEQALEMLCSRPVERVKLAVQADHAADLTRLRDWCGRLDRPGVRLAMGLGGTLSRARYPFFGSEWTYVSADEHKATAAGQFSLAQAEQMQLPDSARQPFVALVGGPKAAASPGPRVYNRLYQGRGWPFSYCLALGEERPDSVFSLLKEMGAMGASVTMPHKAAAWRFADRSDKTTERIGATNTLRFTADGCQAINTDVPGVVEPLRQALAGQQADGVLVLGGGGAARAALLACEQLGLSAVAAVRDPRRVRAQLPPGGSVLPWVERTRVRADVLINATGLAGDHPDLWPVDKPLGKQLVFDLTVSATDSLLLQRARQEGCRQLDAMAMWLAQGAAQMSYITGQAVTVDDLRECLP